MAKAKVLVHPGFEIGEISPRLYGAFLEPIGTMVYGSMYNPKHPTADEKGFRRDFLDALRESGLPAVRLPGGNYVSGWRWKDSIGPDRKANLDMAWSQYIPNDIGHDEYLQWAELAGLEPMYTVNLGTGTLNDAIDIVEYTNHPGGTYWSDLRRRNGREAPYGVKTWYLGNEMDGPWQIGSWERNPKGYGILANEVSKAMKWTDPSIETVACVSSSPNLPHYPEWDLEALRECYNTVDYISLHHYHSAPIGDYTGMLGGTAAFEDYINTEIAVSDFVQASLKNPRKMMLSFDEYGSFPRLSPKPHMGMGPYGFFKSAVDFSPRQYVKHNPDSMREDFFPGRSDMLSALTEASVMLIFLRHADRVKIGCMTEGLRAAAATSRDHVFRNATFYPLTQLIRYGRGVSLETKIECEEFSLPGRYVDNDAQYPDRQGLKYIDAATAYDAASGELTIFVINRSSETDFSLDLDVSGFKECSFVEHIEMHSSDMLAANTYENPDAIVPKSSESATFENGIVSSVVKRLSWNVFRVKARNNGDPIIKS
ncbi:MAG: alpha-L-arabinofuranosidase [Clostridiales bacterium]|jgi:alpha-N-arabinofuranosidase|nr:alpha-L-arabinofuranosidase [Clostridiales bacterium]